MTEFIITVPMFIVAFVGLTQLGLFTEKSVKTWARAHRNTFQVAIPSSQIRWSPMAQPTAAAVISAATMGLGTPIHQSGVQEGLVLASETTTYASLGLNGHWGESSMRTAPVDFATDMHYIEGMRTQNSSDIIGNSTLSKDLFDESVGDFNGSGGGALGALNSLLSGSGLRPAMAAGMRYGAVGAYADDSMSVAGRSMNFRASFTCLVPPFPLTGFEAASVPTGVVRLTMENTGQYEEILGIAWSQPYPGGSLSVPTFAELPGGTR